MSASDPTELVTPGRVVVGDVIHDELGKRWLTVTEIQALGETPAGVDGDPDGRRVFSFCSGGPENRVTVEETERVRRHRH
jgi:hypothetical protein